MPLLATNCWVTVVACAGFSCVSPCTRVIFVLLAVLSMDTASWAKCSCSVPSGATWPVIGASMPIDVVQLVVAAPELLVDPDVEASGVVLLELFELQPATTSAPKAIAMMRMRLFIR